MHQARKSILKVSVSEILAQLLGESYAPREILEENRLIHHRIGLDGDHEYSIVIGGIEDFINRKSNLIKPDSLMLDTPICLVFKPDAVRDGVVYELKILRRFSDREKLMLHGYLQLQLELYALGLDRGKLLIYRYDDGKIEEYNVELNIGLAEKIIAWWIQSFKTRGEVVTYVSSSVKGRLRAGPIDSGDS